jgi:adenylate cyclase class 2
MKTEIEAKFLDIDPSDIRTKLKDFGATLVYPETTVRQKVFDYPDFRLDKEMSWLRLREENGVIVLTFKKWEKEGIEGMKEIEMKTDSFEETERLLFGIGMIIKSTQTKKRELWKLDGVEFMIDTWPWIPTFIEIEGNTENEVHLAADKLGLLWEKALFGGVSRIYKEYFDVEYEQIDRCPEVIFSPTPEWLEKKRIMRS